MNISFSDFFWLFFLFFTLMPMWKQRRVEEARARELAKTLTKGRWTHDYPVFCEELRNLGLPVNNRVPKEIYELMEYYPQPPQRRPSVQYIPLLYGREEGVKKP